MLCISRVRDYFIGSLFYTWSGDSSLIWYVSVRSSVSRIEIGERE